MPPGTILQRGTSWQLPCPKRRCAKFRSAKCGVAWVLSTRCGGASKFACLKLLQHARNLPPRASSEQSSIVSLPTSPNYSRVSRPRRPPQEPLSSNSDKHRNVVRSAVVRNARIQPTSARYNPSSCLDLKGGPHDPLTPGGCKPRSPLR